MNSGMDFSIRGGIAVPIRDMGMVEQVSSQ